MNAHNLIIEALDSIIAFNVADYLIGNSVADQAALLAGISPDDMADFTLD